MNIRLAQAAAAKIPGNTIEEKISWLEKHLDTELGKMYQSGQLTRADIYRMMAGDLKQSDEDTKKLLTPYAKQITELRKLATELMRSDVDPDRVIVKLLQRKNEVLVKQLSAFYASSRRSEEVFSPLLTIKDRKEVATVQKFVAEEIESKRLQFKSEFLDFAQGLMSQFPGLTMDHILALINKYPPKGKADKIREQIKFIGAFNDDPLSDKLSDEQLVDLYGQIFSFRYKIFTMGQANLRPWNAILSQTHYKKALKLIRD